MDESASILSGGHELTAASDPEMIASLRHRVSDLARDSGADDATIRDLELVVSELATNVVQHSASPTIRMVFRREPTQWVLDVDDADQLDELSTKLPGADALTGRGLFIVQSIMDDVQIIDDGDHRLIRCIKHTR